MVSGKSAVTSLLIIAGLLQITTATVHTVGEGTGWTIGQPAGFYSDWAKPRTFVVGDQLVFNYSLTQHDVLEVSPADFKACNVASPLESHKTSGGVTITLATAGTHNYICGVANHCSASNMKLSIEVLPATAPVPAASPSVNSNTTTTTSSALTPALRSWGFIGAVLACFSASFLF